MGTPRNPLFFARMRRMAGAATRSALVALSLSAAGLVAIVTREGYSDRVIIPTRGDVPTIGFGTTEGVKPGDTTTPVKALQRALTDAQQYEGALKRCVKVPLHQHEYDAYVAFSYNIGSAAFCGSTVVKRLNAGDYAGACNAILLWKRFRDTDCSQPNKICGGLWADRLRTHSQCLGDA